MIDCNCIVICGATATGKTDVGILLARELNGEIISCDSMQVFRKMNIGTAKPTITEQKSTRFHLIDIVDPNEYYSVAAYQTDAKKAYNDIISRGKLPIIVGGTGLYLRALLEGYTIPPSVGDSVLRNQLVRQAQAEGPEILHQRLSIIDPQTASRLSPNDAPRIIRAIEVFELTGKSISEQQRKAEPLLNIRKFGMKMPRDLLVERINARVDVMLKMGWQEEVRSLLDDGYAPELVPMRSLGYRHLVEFILNQSSDWVETVEQIKRDTRRFAKRQATWFRKEQNVEWIDSQFGAEQAADDILTIMQVGGKEKNG